MTHPQVELLAQATSAFGASARAKLANPAAAGQPEDQLRGPLEILVPALAGALGHPARQTVLVGETKHAETGTRPDYSLTVAKALVGFIEVKAAGKGADPRKFKDEHDKAQWAKLKALPNLLYTDGNAFSLWRNGERKGEIVARRRCRNLGRETESADGHGISATPDGFPDTIDFDATAGQLKVGAGRIGPVSAAVWTYAVSGKQVLRQWFSYRKKNRERPQIGDRRKPSPLGDIQPDHWLPEYTEELLNVLNVLGLLVELEPKQADLLARVVEGPLVAAEKVAM